MVLFSIQKIWILLVFFYLRSLHFFRLFQVGEKSSESGDLDGTKSMEPKIEQAFGDFVFKLLLKWSET